MRPGRWREAHSGYWPAKVSFFVRQISGFYGFPTCGNRGGCRRSSRGFAMKKLELSAIRIDGGTQSRSFINEEIVAEYADAMRANTALPPVTIFYDGATTWLAAGFHRYHAPPKAELSDIRSATRR